jgi:hypothetical protein
MRRMPEPPRTEGQAREVEIEALQLWIWRCLEAGWNPSDTTGLGTFWTHEDQQEAMQKHGFTLLRTPNGHYDLFVMRRSPMYDADPAHAKRQLLDKLVRGATVEPLFAKALILLTRLKLIGDPKDVPDAEGS